MWSFRTRGLACRRRARRCRTLRPLAIPRLEGIVNGLGAADTTTGTSPTSLPKYGGTSPLRLTVDPIIARVFPREDVHKWLKKGSQNSGAWLLGDRDCIDACRLIKSLTRLAISHKRWPRRRVSGLASPVALLVMGRHEHADAHGGHRVLLG